MRSLRLLPALTRVFFTLVLATSCNASSSEPGPQPPPDPDLRVLFIGNSLTYSNDIPTLVDALVQTAGSAEFHYEAVAFGNYSLEDHWNRGDALRAIDRGGWDIVVLQQGPSSLPESRVLLLEYVRRFAERIRAAGGRPAVYMVWPELVRAHVWDAVTTNHRDAARTVDGILIPVGEAIRAMVRDHPDLEVLGVDGFHPSLTGSYLAALVMYGQLTGHSPAGLSRQRAIVPLSPSDATTLEETADQANARFGFR
jgi:hypothetical protein